MIEIFYQVEFLENNACGWGSLGGGGGLQASELRQHFGDAGIDAGVDVATGGVNRAVVDQHLVHHFGLVAEIGEKVEQVAADIAAQKVVGDIGSAGGMEDLLDRSANVARRVDKSSVYVEEVGAELGNHV